MKLIHGDSTLVLDEMEENSIDIVVTDPPYEILNKVQWDIMPSSHTFRKILRVMKPNSPAFIMSAPRQDLYVEMILRIKQAGFKVNYNSMYWLYNTATIKGHINRENSYITGLNYRNSTELIIVASKPNNTGSEKGSTTTSESQHYGSFTKSPNNMKRNAQQTQQLITRYFDTEPIYPSTFILDANPVAGLSENTVRLHSLDTWWDSVFIDIRKPVPSELEFIKRNPNDGYRGMYVNSRVDRENRDNHLTVKPVKLFTYLLATFGRERGTVLDPFCGTGTIFPAARNVNMDAIGIEFQKDYVNIIKKRMEMENLPLEVEEK